MMVGLACPVCANRTPEHKVDLGCGWATGMSDWGVSALASVLVF